MGETVKILLDYPSDVYYPDQTISGRVQCSFSKEKKVRGVRIKFKGRAKTSWTVRHGKTNCAYTAKEVYFNQEYILAGGEDQFILAAGKHTYAFSYILPQGLPSSFEGEFGRVLYTIKAVVARPWKFDYEDDCVLQIISPLDLNLIPELGEPCGLSMDKDLTCCWCKPGRVTLKFSLPVTGFVPGQEMNINCYVMNMSDVNVEAVVFTIIKDIQFIAVSPFPRTKEREITTEISRESGIGAHAEKSWISNCRIPSNVNFENVIACSIIGISYRARIQLFLPCQYGTLTAEFPIMFGTAPLSVLNTNLPGSPGLQTYSIGASYANEYPAPPSYTN